MGSLDHRYSFSLVRYTGILITAQIVMSSNLPKQHVPEATERRGAGTLILFCNCNCPYMSPSTAGITLEFSFSLGRPIVKGPDKSSGRHTSRAFSHGHYLSQWPDGVDLAPGLRVARCQVSAVSNCSCRVPSSHPRTMSCMRQRADM